MKLNYGLKFVGIGMAVAVIVGCASVGSVANKMVDNKQEGIIYGTGAVANDSTAKQICDKINNADPRCTSPDNYVVVVTFAKFGFADGAVGINSLVPKNFPSLNLLNKNFGTGDKNSNYVKAKVTSGKLGELLEIVSTNGDGKCYWSGMPRAGGTVCPAYNYDYRKDFTGVVFR